MKNHWYKNWCYKSAALGLFLFFIAQFVYAEQTNDPRINQVISRLNQMPIVMGQLEQKKQLQGFAKPLRSQGHFIFWKAKGVHIAIEKPFFNAITITQNGIINWSADGTGTLAQEQSGVVQKEINKTLLAFLSADTDYIERIFTASWTFDQNQWQLKLTPKLDMIAQHLREVNISGSEFMNELTVIAHSGDVTELKFSAQSSHKGLSTADCQWFFVSNSAPSPNDRCP